MDKTSVGDGEILISNKDDIRHISKVLRLKAGDRVLVSDCDSFDYQSEILDIQGDEKIVLRILDKQRFSGEPDLLITLFQGLPKQGKIETIIQKSVELGVHKVVPIFTDRTVVTDKGNLQKKLERWQRISDEAVKQCLRGIPPVIEYPMDFQRMLKEINTYDQTIIPYENEDVVSIKEVLRGYLEKPKTMALIIGPEGGFSQKEVDMAVEAGCRPVTLGKNVLRTETAGIAALSMIMYELEL